MKGTACAPALIPRSPTSKLVVKLAKYFLAASALIPQINFIVNFEVGVEGGREDFLHCYLAQDGA